MIYRQPYKTKIISSKQNKTIVIEKFIVIEKNTDKLKLEH